MATVLFLQTLRELYMGTILKNQNVSGSPAAGWLGPHVGSPLEYWPKYPPRVSCCMEYLYVDFHVNDYPCIIMLHIRCPEQVSGGRGSGVLRRGAGAECPRAGDRQALSASPVIPSY